MSIFRSNSPSADLSALLDNELSPHDAQELTRKLREGTEEFREYAHVAHVHSMCAAPQISDDQIAAAQARVHVRLERSIRAVHQRDMRPWWERSVTIPMPVAATAVVAVMLFAVILAGRVTAPTMPGASAEPVASGEAQSTAAMIADRADSVNLQVNIHGDQTEQLLQWLNERQSVDAVTIQLPDTAQFQLRGEPVFLRPELPGEDSAVHSSDYGEVSPGDVLDITPLEDFEE